MAVSKKNTGDFGEGLAAAFMEKNGASILCRNYYAKGGEIDIIARDGGYLVFVEVKYRRNAAFGSGAEAITRKKMERIRLCALQYITEQGLNDADIRFDAVIITQRAAPNVPEIEHIKNAFY